MRECPQCLSDVLGEAERTCPACGAPLPGPQDARGAPLAAAQAPLSQPQGEPLAEETIQFRRQFEDRAVHLPEQALRRAEEILAAAQTELRRVTVLIVDLRGFSKRAREISAEELSRLAGGFYQICSDHILRRGGFVVKFMGDAALAVFGAPVAFDQDTENAVRAALDIRDRFAREEPDAENPMAVTIGLATGTVQSGLVATPAGKAYDVLGDTVNLAARLQSAAGANEVLICAETARMVQRAFDLVETKPLALKNISDAYVAFRVLDEKEEPGLRRAFDTPFCGRQEELRRLAEFFSAPRTARHAAVAHVTGEAGLGKSRLVHEALQRAGAGERAATGQSADSGQRAAAGQRAVWLSASPAESYVLLSPILQWLRREIGFTLDDAPAAIAERIERYMAERFEEEDDRDPLLLEYLFGVPRAIEALQGTPPERLQRNLFSLLRALLLRRPPAPQGASAAPVIVVADDVQWMDSLTGRFLAALADWPVTDATNGEPGVSAPDLRLALVYRPGAEVPVAASPDHLRFSLGPLPEADRHELLRRLVPTSEFLPEIRKQVLSKASGNPLFLEEVGRLVREAMANNNDLSPEAIRNHIVNVIPASLRDLIQSRIDRLETRLKQTLQCASLLGLEFSLNLIEMFDAIREGLAGHLQALRAMRYLDKTFPARLASEGLYYFTHGLFRDVAYAMLLEEQKQALHLSLARRLEDAFADRLHEYSELLAFHYTRGGEAQKGVYYLVKAADRQASFGEARAALGNYSQALELLRGLPATPARQTLMARVLVRSGRMNRLLGDPGEAEEMFESALALAEGLGNPHLALEARLDRAVSRIWRGEHESAREAMEAAADEAARLQNARAELFALNALGVYHFQRGAYERSLRYFQHLAQAAEPLDLWQVQADAFNNAGLIYWRWNQYPQALKAFKRALPLRRRGNDRHGLCAALINVGIIQEQLGEVGPARRSYAGARVLAAKTGHAQALASVESNLSNLERRCGVLSAAVEHAQRALGFARQAGDPAIELDANENLALALMAQGGYGAARECLAAAAVLAAKTGNALKRLDLNLDMIELNLAEGAEPADLAGVNAAIADIQKGGHTSLLSRAYRAKARLLLASAAPNRLTAAEYAQMALDLARNHGNLFEEIESWGALRACHERAGAKEKVERCDSELQRLRWIAEERDVHPEGGSH